jgi:hypothetical protein
VTREAIEPYFENSPFRPVKLITSSGNSYAVPHADFVTFSPTGRTCLVYAEDGEYYTTLDVQTITGMVPLKVRPPGGKKPPGG